MNLKLTFLGSGSAFFPPSLGNYQSNMLIEVGDGKMLFDCGTHCHMSLAEQGLSILDIDQIFISHLHADHIGGLEETAFKTYFSQNKKISLYSEEQLLKKLWENSLKGGLEIIEGKELALNDYFSLHFLDNWLYFMGVRFEVVRVPHVNARTKFMDSLGLRFRVNEKTIFITSDTKFDPCLIPYYEESDIIFHDCETSPYKSGVHAHFSELETLPDHIKKKMWLYHYNAGEKPDAKDFLGYVQKGQSFIF
jgi:ribonuclease BN (tRNA processing enzyme)